MANSTEHFEDEYRNDHSDSALSVTRGVSEQPIVNPRFNRSKPRRLTVDDYIDGIGRGDVTVLSQAITLVESNNPAHQSAAQQIVARALPMAVSSIRIGITGVPGAGKSTFIEAVGAAVAARGLRLAVLAIDPSSSRSGGSILGDKTRMESLAVNPRVFIRPSPSAGSLGGVARKTRETIALCEAAGYDVIFVETVGVGQSETAVHSMVDLFMLLQIGGAGDELQGIKRGIMEMADLVAVNKADGDNIARAELAKTQINSALHLFPPTESGIVPEAVTCSSVTGAGIDEVWRKIEALLALTRSNGYFEANRRRQGSYWLREAVNGALLGSFYNNPACAEAFAQAEADIAAGRASSFTAAEKLIAMYENSKL